MLFLLIGLTACDSDDDTEESVDEPEIQEVTEIEEPEADTTDEVETDDENAANFQVLYDMTSKMMAALGSADATNMDAVIAAFEQTVSITDAVVSNDAHSQLTRDLASVMYEMSIAQLGLIVDNQDEIPVDTLEPLVQVAIENIHDSHVIFEQRLGD